MHVGFIFQPGNVSKVMPLSYIRHIPDSFWFANSKISKIEPFWRYFCKRFFNGSQRMQDFIRNRNLTNTGTDYNCAFPSGITANITVFYDCRRNIIVCRHSGHNTRQIFTIIAGQELWNVFYNKNIWIILGCNPLTQHAEKSRNNSYT